MGDPITRFDRWHSGLHAQMATLARQGDEPKDAKRKQSVAQLCRLRCDK